MTAVFYALFAVLIPLSYCLGRRVGWTEGHEQGTEDAYRMWSDGRTMAETELARDDGPVRCQHTNDFKQ